MNCPLRQSSHFNAKRTGRPLRAPSPGVAGTIAAMVAGLVPANPGWRFVAIAAVIFASIAHPVSAQLTIIESDGTQPTIFRMTVSPAAEPKPALKYHFLVPP